MVTQTIAGAIDRLLSRLAPLALQHQGAQCLQLSEHIDAPPLLAWLASQDSQGFEQRFYWRGRRHGEEVAGIGAALDLRFDTVPGNDELDRLFRQYQGMAQDSSVRFYGGIAFDCKQDAWPEFGQARFVLPRLELRNHGNQAQLMLNLVGPDWSAEVERARACLAQLGPLRPLTPLGPAHVLSRQDTPVQARWHQLIGQITDPLFIEQTPKVVMARETQLRTSKLPNPWTVLHAWQLLNPGSYQYGFQFGEGHSFISCSPERLFLRRGRELSTEALAGTTVRGFTEAEDQALANALLADGKNSHENQLVREHIEEQLTPLSTYVGAEESPTILKLNHIQHLHRAIQAELKPGVTDLQLLGALHPTPAVGGLPRESAMGFIRQREGFSRGWYAGACGYFGANESEFSVAIRSARFEPEKVTLFAGAGIVADSEAESEWHELNNKLTTVLGILNGL